MEKKIILTAGFFGMSAVILGAFGAHAFKNVLTAEQLVSFETGVKYQMYHALFLLFLGMNTHLPLKTKKTILTLIILGIIFFSGSIYLLSTKAVTGIDFKAIGIVTPIGGSLLIAAWAVLTFNFFKKK
ncbi:DUF423 domain-containing protein [Flavobacterium sp.]|jgi:uncharacterized membrane protein YgdD (TMEM256/DUF423 family)|uniref:DUF423 domain-containing protein n=1 Tax=Flavobacterium sp. TaxID=239 RepID=UPI0037BFB99F